MKTVSRSQIHPIKMSTNEPKEVLNCGSKVINTDGFVYQYVGFTWVQLDKATREDRREIPELID